MVMSDFKPRFDLTINLGHILTIATLLVGGFLAYASVEFRVGNVEKTISDYQAMRDQVRDNAAQIKALILIAADASAVNKQLATDVGNIRENIAAIKATMGRGMVGGP